MRTIIVFFFATGAILAQDRELEPSPTLSSDEKLGVLIDRLDRLERTRNVRLGSSSQKVSNYDERLSASLEHVRAYIDSELRRRAKKADELG